MKIGIIKIKHGSLGRYYRNLTKSLAGKSSIKLFRIDPHVPSIRSFPPIFRHAIGIVQLLDKIRKYKLDILHCPHEVVPSFFWLSKAARKVVTIHGAAPFVSGKEMVPEAFTWRRTCYRWSIRLFRGQVTTFVAPSQSVKEEIAKGYFIEPENIHVVYPGVDTALFRRVSQEKINDFLSRLNIERPYIVWASSYRPVKNLISLIRAFQKAADLLAKQRLGLSLVIAGVTEKAYHDEVRATAEKSHIKNRIHFLPPLNNSLPTLLSGARAAAVVSYYEGFSFAILESMACGVPVIATKVGGTCEAGGKAPLYLDNPYDVDSLSNAIIQLVTDDRLHKELQARGAEHLNLFSLDSFGERMERFYEKILHERFV
jgi:glycosyltransferase involved in cell wall biosynthesis